MTARQVIVPGAMPSRDANGRALPAKLRFYEPDTALTTVATVYTDDTLTVAHSFPILSNAAGRWPPIWADEAESFDVAWSDQVFDRTIATYSGVRPVDDAVLASAAIAQDAADDAEAARDEAEAIADKFGDLDTAVTQAQGSANAAAQSAQDAEAAAQAAQTWDPANYVPNTRTVTGAGLATGGGDLSANRTITVTAAVAADVRFGNDTTKAVTAAALTGSAEFITLTDAATVAWAVTDGYNAKLTLTANGHTIGAPTGLSDGVTYTLNINPATYTVAWNGIWDFGSNGTPTLPASVWSKVTGQYNAARNKIEAGLWVGA